MIKGTSTMAIQNKKKYLNGQDQMDDPFYSKQLKHVHRANQRSTRKRHSRKGMAR